MRSEDIRARRSVFTIPLNLSQPLAVTATALFSEAVSAPEDASGASPPRLPRQNTAMYRISLTPDVRICPTVYRATADRRERAAASRSVFRHLLLRENACRAEQLVGVASRRSAAAEAALRRCSTMRDIVEEGSGSAMRRTYSAVFGGNRLWGGVRLSEIYEHLAAKSVVKDRTWLGRTYRACAEAQEMISCIVAQPFCGGDSPRTKRAFAAEICRELQRQHAIVHVWEEEKQFVGSRQKKRVRGVRSSISTFRDRVMFFRFCLDTSPAPIESDGTTCSGESDAANDEAFVEGELALDVVAVEEGFSAALDLSLVEDG